ncbi:unnamed protein product [Effrenium voratum]|uniref:Apple domain-containing protein n=1 Tax=Effrenium voratum TaxID=2562239 RepID=A0AA36JQ01_9DINO|nr:unnamed protein product [Effrenium voratum]
MAEMAYPEWQKSWQPGEPKEVSYQVPAGAKPGSTLLVDVGRGYAVPTLVPESAHGGLVLTLVVDLSRIVEDSRSWGFNDPSQVAGGVVADAASCQAKCSASSSCDVFTFLAAGEKCLLQGSDASEVLMPEAVSGPKACPDVTLPDALQQTAALARSAAGAARDGEQAEEAVADAVHRGGVKFGLSNMQKAQLTSIGIGRLGANQAALSGQSEVQQIQAAAAAATAWSPGQQAAMYAGGGFAAESPKALQDAVQSRISYAMLMALDLVAPQSHNATVAPEQLQTAARLGALLLALDGSGLKEVYTSTRAAMQKVAQDYGKSTAVQVPKCTVLTALVLRSCDVRAGG